LRRAQEPQGRALIPSGFGADFHLDRLSFPGPLAAGIEVEDGDRALADVHEGEILGAVDAADAADEARAQGLAGEIAIPLDEEPLGAAVQGHDTPALARGCVEISAAHAQGRRYPRPASRVQVS
jgi:hypothetical protein